MIIKDNPLTKAKNIITLSPLSRLYLYYVRRYLAWISLPYTTMVLSQTGKIRKKKNLARMTTTAKNLS